MYCTWLRVCEWEIPVPVPVCWCWCHRSPPERWQSWWSRLCCCGGHQSVERQLASFQHKKQYCLWQNIFKSEFLMLLSIWTVYVLQSLSETQHDYQNLSVFTWVQGSWWAPAAHPACVGRGLAAHTPCSGPSQSCPGLTGTPWGWRGGRTLCAGRSDGHGWMDGGRKGLIGGWTGQYI